MLIRTDDDLFLMVNLRSRTTNLPMNVLLSARGHTRHAARVKVQMDHRFEFDIDNLAVVSVDPVILIEGHLASSDLTAVQQWLDLNRVVILDHWNGLTDGDELIRALRPLPHD